MTAQQRQAVEQMLREGPLDLMGDLQEQRTIFADMVAGMPLPDGVSWDETSVGGVPAIEFEVPDAAGGAMLYVHGGAFTTGSARTGLGLASDLGWRAGLGGVCVDYRLAPEHPHPAAVDDVVAAYRASDPMPTVLVGESAGGALVMLALLSLRNAGDPLPAAAVLMSPVTDLTFAADSLESKAAVDPALTAAGLRLRTGQYLAGADPRATSPRFADLAGLPPVLVQAGSHEILLDDAVGLAAALAAADVDVRLDVVAGVPHVFQGFAAQLTEGSAALDRAAAFVTEHGREP